MSPQRRAGLGTNQEAVRRHNLGTVLRHVHGAGQISRAELTSLMGLNRSTIAGLVGELEALGVTEHAAPAAGGKQGAGRPSAEVRIPVDGPYVVAVDLGVDKLVVARVGLGGRVHERMHAAVATVGEPKRVGHSVAELVRDLVDAAPPSAPLVGIGISVPGLVRRSDGMVRLAPNMEWHDVAFGEILRAQLGLDVPVAVANDADLGALAEHVRGAALGIDDLIYVSGNVGVGAGVITGGVRLEGVGGYAGEVGHLRFNPQGQPCHCGNLGCWETEVGGHAIADAIACPPGQVAQLEEVIEGFLDPTPALRATGTALGHGLAILVNTFNPRMIILGGYFRPLYPLVRAEVNAGLADRALPAPLESVSVVLPGLGCDSPLLGAAEVALEPLFADPVATLAGTASDLRARLRA